MTKITSPSPVFQAKWPEPLKPTIFGKVAEVIKKVLPLIIFPIGILHFITRAMIHPASVQTSIISDAARKRIQHLGGKIVQFKTPDEETLKAAYFKGSSHSKKGIIHAPGNSANLASPSPRETIYAEKFLKFARKNVGNVDVLVLNYRGVGHSTGSSSPQGLALDTYSAGEYLHRRKGIEPSKVLFYGHSLGGYAAVKGGAFFQKEHATAKVSIVSDRSFSDLANIVHQLFGVVVGALVYLLRWQLDAKADWHEFKGRKIIIYDKTDQVIPHVASFYKGMQTYDTNYQLPPMKKNDTIELVSKGSDAYDPHNRPLNSVEASKLGREIRSALF